MKTTPDLPTTPRLGDVHKDKEKHVIFVGRGWTNFPVTAKSVARFADGNGWGTKTEIKAKRLTIGITEDNEPVRASIVRVILTVGREPGLTKEGRQSKGYTYRYVWSTERAGTFRLENIYRRTSTDPNWVEVGSSYEIRQIIAMNPVIIP